MPYDEDDYFNPGNVLHSPMEGPGDYLDRAIENVAQATEATRTLADEMDAMARKIEAGIDRLADQKTAEEAIERIRQQVTCCTCGRQAWLIETVRGFCRQCWHHLRQEVAA